MADTSPLEEQPLQQEQVHQEAEQAEETPPNAPEQRDAELTDEFWGGLGPLHAPDGCEQITPDGGVLKHVLVEGSGDKPKLFARCLVHYIGRLQSNGYIFLDTKTESQTQQPVKVVAGRHTSAKETGLFMGVASMRIGERAAIYVQDPKYGYGEAGSFSFPAVPPSEQLTYEVECVDFEDQPDDQPPDSTNLLFEERLERAEQRRLIGNQLFADGKFREAMAKYAGALSYMDEDFMMQLEGFYEDKANEVKIPIHLNMAACQLRIKDYHTAIYNCSEVLKLHPDHSKALYRRGVARHALGQTEGALKDLTKAAELAPGDAAISKELAALRVTLKAERAAQTKLYKGQFKFPDVVPQQPTDGTQGEGAAPGVDQTTQGLRQRKGAALKANGEQGEGGDGSSAGARKGWFGWLFGLLALFLTWLGRLVSRPALRA